MARTDPAKLAAALRENLRKRKAQARSPEPEPSFGSDEEGDVVMPEDAADRDGAWVREGSKKI